MTGSLYVHIPFCLRRCDYCDFYSTVLSDGSVVRRTVDVLKQQMTYIADRWSPCLQSVYFGGGTPSLLPFPLLEELTSTVIDRFTVSDGCEITVEANPETATADFLRFLRSTPVNRLSLGIQSFNDGVLRLLGRNNTRRTALEAADRVAADGPVRWSLDFIGEIPGVPDSILIEDLKEAIRRKPPHLSLYALSIAENSPLEKRLSGKEISSAVENGFNLAENYGYNRYEISNCAFAGEESRHNTAYWEMNAFWGCGPSASGTFRDNDGTVCRWEGLTPLSAFLNVSTVEETWRKETVSARDYAFENVMMGCRMKRGIELSGFEAKTGYSLKEMAPETVKKALNKRLFDIKNGRFFPLSDGFRYLNRFLVDFLLEFDK
ncbi:MAG: radical SAM family heme chaperone HemW [Spirochaetia bacterium]|nr:radical SAM family heme chaperone HemW [Spirochaetia bacterium]